MSRAAETTPARFLGIAEGTGFLGRIPNEDERDGFKAFFRGPSREQSSHEAMTYAWRSGWHTAAQVCFAQGALAHAPPNDAACPYTANTPAWEAWIDGYNAAAAQALEIEE